MRLLVVDWNFVVARPGRGHLAGYIWLEGVVVPEEVELFQR